MRPQTLKREVRHVQFHQLKNPEDFSATRKLITHQELKCFHTFYLFILFTYLLHPDGTIAPGGGDCWLVRKVHEKFDV